MHMAEGDLYSSEMRIFNLEAEQSVLGAILIDPSCLSDVMAYISVDSFSRPQNRELYAIILRMFASGQPIDFVTVLNEAIADKVFENEGDAKVYLAELAQIVPSVANVTAYAKIVQEKHYLRRLVDIASDIIQNAQEGTSNPSELLDLAEQKIFEIRQGRDAKGLRRIEEVIVGVYDHLQKLSGDDKEQYLGTRSGFSGLDHVLTGLNKSDLLLVAGRPGMGKTSFALNICENVAMRAGKKVVIFSLEMSAEQLVQRMLSSQASISSYSLRTGTLTPDEWIRLASSADMLSRSPIFIDDATDVTVASMKAKLRRIPDLGLIVIDYLQLMTGNRRTDNRAQEISEITRGLKTLAKEFDVPVICCSQLSRATEGRQDRRPVLSDLRESGSIEQDADVVMFIYRDAYYNRESEEQNVAECIIAKNRHGETGSVKIGWDGQFTRFSNLEYYRDEQ